MDTKLQLTCEIIDRWFMITGIKQKLKFPFLDPATSREAIWISWSIWIVPLRYRAAHTWDQMSKLPHHPMPECILHFSSFYIYFCTGPATSNLPPDSHLILSAKVSVTTLSPLNAINDGFKMRLGIAWALIYPCIAKQRLPIGNVAQKMPQ